MSFISSTSSLYAGGEYHGLWKSTDFGQNWGIITPGPGNWTIYDIQPSSDLHYQGPTMYVATAGGVYRSDDFGDSWASVGFTGTQVSSVAFDPEDPDRAWAGTASAGVHYTLDGGQNWVVGAGLPYALYPSLELVDLESGELRVLVSFQQNGSGVYWSDDGGATFSAAPVPGSYHPDLSARWGDDAVAYLSTDAGIYRSWDRGSTWEPCPGSSGLSWAALGDLDDTAFKGTGNSGVWWSPDQGSSWQALNTGIGNRCVWDIVYGETPEQLFAGLRGFGVVELTEPQLGISETAPSGLSIATWPNPSSGMVTVTVQSPVQGSPVMGVYDTAGRLAATLNVVEGSAIWTPGRETPPGLYLVKLFCDGETAVSRVVLLP